MKCQLSALFWVALLCSGCPATVSSNHSQEKPIMQEIASNHPHVRFMGRVDTSQPDKPSFSFPGVSVRLRFKGTRIHVLLDDHAQHQSAETTNYFNVIVDDNKPVRMKTTPEQKEYILAENLPDAPHQVELFKRTESSHGEDLNVGKITLNGFRINETATLLPPIEKPLQLEFIGDSITCGYGNELSSVNPVDEHYTTANSNAYMAWGAIAARQLNAEYVAVAYSGRGVVRNYAGYESPTIPDIYLSTLPDDPTAAPWNPANYIPHVVVINLGTNDFSEGLSSNAEIENLQAQFEKRYFSFLKEIQQYYPGAAVVVTLGPMLSNGFPPGVKALQRVQKVLKAIVKTLRKEGMNIHLLELSPQKPPFGEDFHPTIATHQRMANELVTFLTQRKLVRK